MSGTSGESLALGTSPLAKFEALRLVIPLPGPLKPAPAVTTVALAVAAVRDPRSLRRR